jgi:GH15 family glucan-1,4-alpha-glucosidase
MRAKRPLGKVKDSDTDSDYPLIVDHGLIGNLQTAALSSSDGTIDWFCAARFTFDKMLIYANHLRVYSEEIALTGGPIGNFPQGSTHLAQIDTALTLNSKLQRR